MVVNEDDAGRIHAHGIAKELTDPYEGRRHVALVDGLHAEHVVLRVEDDDPQLLALEAAHLKDQPIGDVPRAADRPATRRPIGQKPSPQLEGGDKLRRLYRTDTGERGELQLVRAGQAAETVM